MALEGNLKDFSLGEMFRLLQTGSKSGTLHVEGAEGEGIVCFSDGGVFHAASGPESEPMVKRLTRMGVISEKQLRQAQGLMKIQKRDKGERKLGQILVDEGYLEADVLAGFVREQVSDALFDLLRREEGELRFEPDEACETADIGITVAVEDVMSDAGKRLEMWNKIREKIPSLDSRFAMASAPGSKNIDIHLKPREWMVLCFLHGGRSVRELSEAIGYSDFETARVLYGMYAGGLIEQVDSTSAPSAS